ncbi:MAG TPA: hypothetical protein VNN20_03410 [Thermodesulfobacteriota bacterium]|nr:hypothetical protein [Thermodesulfobacteriota bacterium]
MAFIEVNLSRPGRRKINDMGRPVASLILLSNERGIKCEVRPPVLVIEGDMGILLEILYELDNDSFRKISNRVSITVESDEIFISFYPG